jgi:hypothetical protein
MKKGLPIAKGKKAPPMKLAAGSKRQGTAPVPDKTVKVKAKSHDATPPGFAEVKHNHSAPPKHMVMRGTKKGAKAGPSFFGMK